MGLRPRPATGVATAHYGELFQGQIEDETGQQRRCLVSLPCDSLFSRVVFRPQFTADLTIKPERKHKAERAVRLTLERFNATDIGGDVTIFSNIEEGKGCGSSTADCVAVVRAVTIALGERLSEEDVARIVVKAETSSDNTMFRRAVLFAFREGEVVEDFARPLPYLAALGIDLLPSAVVDTLNYAPAAYYWREIQHFQALVGALRKAIRTGDRELLGRVASASATINERFLPKPLFHEVKRLASHVGALGVAAAHSGTVVSILLDPRDSRLNHKFDLLQAKLRELGIHRTFRFQTHDHSLQMATV
jgi:uncharacterized protein involved in propanediol utilization